MIVESPRLKTPGALTSSVLKSPRARNWLVAAWPAPVYLVLVLALTWPAVRNFTTHIIGGPYDNMSGLWTLWHMDQALLGRAPWTWTDLLFYPTGVTLLAHTPGYILAILSLPFQLLGPAAAYNGIIILGHLLTALSMFMLARSLGLAPAPAFFAGVVYLVAPIHLARTYHHSGEVFLPLLPLALLLFDRATAKAMHLRWSVATAVVMLLLLNHDAYLFVFTSFAFGFFGLAKLVRSAPGERRQLVAGLATLAAAMAVFIGPYVWMTLVATAGIATQRLGDVQFYQPDLIQLFLPTNMSWVYSALSPHLPVSLLEVMRLSHFDRGIYLTWTGIVLAAIGLIRPSERKVIWLLFTLSCVILALGPILKVLGQTVFTVYALPITLPYAMLTSVPGLDFMRAPGRFMLIGIIGVAILAGLGLQDLVRRLPRAGPVVVALALVGLLAETWPAPVPANPAWLAGMWPRPLPTGRSILPEFWPTTPMPQVSEFHRMLARDPERYGVLDVPLVVRSGIYYEEAAMYMMLQFTHGKPIAAGYVSRVPPSHPDFSCVFDQPGTLKREPLVRINGQVADCFDHLERRLAQHGYRYVIRHKPVVSYIEAEGQPVPWFQPGSPPDQAASELVTRLFDDRPPVYEDDLLAAYQVDPAAEPEPSGVWLEAGPGWHAPQAGVVERWASSPALLYVESNVEQQATLEIVPGPMFEPVPGRPNSRDGKRGTLRVTDVDGNTADVEIETGVIAEVPIHLRPGRQTIRFELAAGSFSTFRLGIDNDSKRYSWSLNTMNLVTAAADNQPGAWLNPGVCEAVFEFEGPVNGTGWSVPERTRVAGRTFNFMAAVQATLNMRTRPPARGCDGPLDAKFWILQTMAPDILESLTLNINGVPIALTVSPATDIPEIRGAVIVRGTVPAEARTPDGRLLLDFSVNRTIVPQGGDRTLALAFDRIQLGLTAGGGNGGR